MERAVKFSIERKHNYSTLHLDEQRKPKTKQNEDLNDDILNEIGHHNYEQSHTVAEEQEDLQEADEGGSVERKTGGMKHLKLSKNMRLGSNSALSVQSPLDGNL